nr:Os05g0410750 [Ipomoea batatas]
MNASAIPCRQYCGTSQNTGIGIIASALSLIPCAAAAFFRFISTKPATRVARMEMKKPMPMRLRKEMPRSSPVKTDMEAAGIWKDFVSVKKVPGDGNSSINLVVLIKQGGIGNYGDLPLLVGGDAHLHKAREGAAGGVQIPVQRVAEDEGEDRESHGYGWDPKPPTPTNIILYIHHHRDGHQHGCPHAEVVPVEESPRFCLLLGVGLVELVGTERHHARPDSTRTQGG